MSEHKLHSWWVVSVECCLYPCLSPKAPPDDEMVFHRSDDANDDYRCSGIESETVMSFEMS